MHRTPCLSMKKDTNSTQDPRLYIYPVWKMWTWLACTASRITYWKNFLLNCKVTLKYFKNSYFRDSLYIYKFLLYIFLKYELTYHMPLCVDCVLYKNFLVENKQIDWKNILEYNYEINQHLIIEFLSRIFNSNNFLNLKLVSQVSSINRGICQFSVRPYIYWFRSYLENYFFQLFCYTLLIKLKKSSFPASRNFELIFSFDLCGYKLMIGLLIHHL